MISKLSALALAGALALSTAASAQMPTPTHDFHAAPAGTYALDRAHTSVGVRVPHLGFSYEVFRFRAVDGKLAWDPADPRADALSVTVDAASIATADTGKVDFAAELTGPQFLDAAKFPTATFVSHGFHVIDATHGKVDGELTIMGVTRPATFDVTLVGAGVGMMKHQVLGVTARTQIDPAGLGLPKFIAGPIEITVDTEFDRQAG